MRKTYWGVGRLMWKQPQFWCLCEEQPLSHWITAIHSNWKSPKCRAPLQIVIHLETCVATTPGTVVNSQKIKKMVLLIFSHHGYYCSGFDQADVWFVLPFEQNDGQKSLIPVSLHDQTSLHWSSVSAGSLLCHLLYILLPGRVAGMWENS